jgi:hypothetical protein
MKIKTQIRAGRLSSNHNATAQSAVTMKVKTGVRAGKLAGNHNATVRCERFAG